MNAHIEQFIKQLAEVAARPTQTFRPALRPDPVPAVEDQVWRTANRVTGWLPNCWLDRVVECWFLTFEGAVTGLRQDEPHRSKVRRGGVDDCSRRWRGSEASPAP